MITQRTGMLAAVLFLLATLWAGRSLVIHHESMPAARSLLPGHLTRAILKAQRREASRLDRAVPPRPEPTSAAARAPADPGAAATPEDLDEIVGRGDESIAPLRALIEQAPDLQTAAPRARALARIGTQGAIRELVELAAVSQNAEFQALMEDCLAAAARPACVVLLQQLAMDSDDAVARVAIRALARAATEPSVRALLESFGQFPPLPHAQRFVTVVEETRHMLQQHPDEAGLTITIESLMTTSPSELTRAAAVAILRDAASADHEKLLYAFDKAFSHEQSLLVRDLLGDALDSEPAPGP